MKTKVDEYAGTCFPDFIPRDTGTVSFCVVTPEELLGYSEEQEPDLVGMVIEEQEGVQHRHVFSPWSRGQLLTMLGTREKWFRSVSRHQEAAELSMRDEVLVGSRLRTRSSAVPGIRILRGVVSASYADIPDTQILSALCASLPDGRVVAGTSGKTDRAMYAYCISAETFHIPGTSREVHPGVVVVNSEVGYTSLWVRPAMFLPERQHCIVMRETKLLRRIHRGSDIEIQNAFTEALKESEVYWAQMPEKLAALEAKTFPSEEEAAEHLYKLVVVAGGSKQLADHCRRAYKAAGHIAHTGVTLFETLCEVTNRDEDKDTRYDEACIAGAVLDSLL